MKNLFIVNPAAGKGKSEKAIPFINQIQIDKVYKIIKTQYPNNCEEIIRNEIPNDWDNIYSVGGDGTINEIVNVFANNPEYKFSLGIIPCGSGNDLIKTLDKNYDRKMSIKNLVERYTCGIEKAIDIGIVNERYFTNISSAGFDAAALINRGKIKKIPFLPGWLAYYLSVFYTLVKCKKYNFTISIDNEKPIIGKYLLVTVSNGKYYGGGMTPTPNADIEDGILDLCLIESMSRFKVLLFFSKFIKGKHEGIKGVSFFRGKSIEIKSPHIFPLNIDGEVSLANHAIFNIKPKALKIILPI